MEHAKSKSSTPATHPTHRRAKRRTNGGNQTGALTLFVIPMMEATIPECPDCKKLGLRIFASSCPHGGSLYQRASFTEAEVKGHKSKTSLRWVSKGNYHYRAENKVYKLDPSRFLVLNHGQEYQSYVPATKIQTISHTISFDNDMLLSVWNAVSKPGSLLPEDDAQTSRNGEEFLEHAFLVDEGMGYQLRQFEGLQGGNQVMEEAFITLAETFCLWQAKLKNQRLCLKVTKSSTGKEVFKRVLQAYESILASPSKTISIQELAQSVCMSEYHFLRSFQAAFGISPHQLQIKKRIEIATVRLREGKEPPSVLAYQLGFNDLSSFSHAFKRWTGESPSRVFKK